MNPDALWQAGGATALSIGGFGAVGYATRRDLAVVARVCFWALLAYGVLAGSLRRPQALYGLPFGAAVWAAGYVVLPEAGLYRPIWEYDAKTLARDLSAHLAYGAGTGAAFWLLTKIR